MGGITAQNVGKISNSILTATQKCILSKYCLYADDRSFTKSVYPSLNTLSEETGYSRSAIQKAVKALMEKEFLILIQAGCSKTRKSNEFLINPSLFSPVVNITCTKLSPQAVNKAVDNSVDNSNAIPPGRLGYTSRKAGAIPPGGPQSSSLTFIEPSHMIGGQQDDFLEKDVDVKMQALGIFEHERQLLICQYGASVINVELIDLNQRRGIEKKGAYLRKVLEQKYGRLVRYAKSRQYYKAIAC